MSIKTVLLSIVILLNCKAAELSTFIPPIASIPKLSKNCIFNKVKTETGSAPYILEDFSSINNLYGVLKKELEPLKTIVIFDIDVLDNATMPIIELLQKRNFEVLISSAFYEVGEAYTKLMELNVDEALNNGKWPVHPISSFTCVNKSKIDFYQVGLLCLAKTQSSPSSIYAASILAPAVKAMNFNLDHIVMVNSYKRKANFARTQLAFVKDFSIFTDKNIIFATINPNLREHSSSSLAVEQEENGKEESNDNEMLFEMDL